ncbi:MAG: hypothetical protein ACOYL6_17670 [Bacteriovoracaceae bacterium]
MKYIIICCILCFSQAYGGNEVGNGGDGIECNGQDQIKLLDFLEAETVDKRKILSFTGDDPYQKVQNVILQLKDIAPKLFEQYKGRLEKFKTRAQFLPNHKLRDLKDSFELVLPKDCDIKQLAIRQLNPKNETSTFIFDEDGWKKMPMDHQAGLILHEIIYEHFWDLGERDSIKARGFNSLLFSEDMKTTKKTELKAFFIKEKISIYL